MKHYFNLYDHPTLAAALTVDESRARRLRYSGGVCVAVELSDDGKTVLSAEVVEQFVPAEDVANNKKCSACDGSGKRFIDGLWYQCGACLGTGESTLWTPRWETYRG